MAELEMATYKQVEHGEKKSQGYKKRIIKLRRDVLIRILGFFLAMAMPMPGVAPFGLSFLAQERKISFRAIISLVMISAGSIVACERIGAAKYIGAGVIYVSVLFVLEKGVKITEFTAGLVAGIAIIVSGMVSCIWQGITVEGVLLLLCEGAATVAGALVIDKSWDLSTTNSISAEKLTGEEKLSLASVCAILLMSLKEIYIGSDFSLINVASGLVLLIIAAGCGVSYSTGAGVLLGLLCGIDSDYFMPVLGAFSFCGFLSGVFSKFGKGGVIAGIILANAMLIVYTNGALKSMLTIYEIMASSVIFLFIPTKSIAMIKNIICLKEGDKENILKIKDGLRTRLRAISTSFEAMSKTLDKLSDKEMEANITDVATLFDIAADKICRACRKASICWGKDFNSTYQSLFGLLETMDSKGTVDEKDVNEYLRSKCSNLTKLLAEINKQFEIYQVRRVWKSRLTESRELVGEQLSGVSQIISGLEKDLEGGTRFDNVYANDIRIKLENKGIKIRDMNVIQNKSGRYTVEMLVKKSHMRNNSMLTIKRVMRSIFGCAVSMNETHLADAGLVRLSFKEEEKFQIETGHAVAKASTASGDNFKFARLSCGKYIITLSDGMGTGNRAARESRAMIELLDSFLQAGFESSVAVKMINSVMIMKSENEAFVTIDMCIIDLYTGEVEFIKNGAEPSFIMRKNFVEEIKASSLPAGIMAGTEADVISDAICDGDTLVMITDGVESKKRGNEWVKGFIEKNRSHATADDLAKSILKFAIEENDGEVLDDMTVLTVKIKTKNEVALSA